MAVLVLMLVYFSVTSDGTVSGGFARQRSDPPDGRTEGVGGALRAAAC
jgi:hypothetical protein